VIKLASEMFVAIQRPPGWMRVLPPLAPLVFSRITATSNDACGLRQGDGGPQD
jgi:hypothetical protein